MATLIGAAHEVPVPGSPSATNRLSRNVVAAARGEPVATGSSLHRFYAVFDLVVLALTAAATWGLYRAVQAVRHRQRPSSRVLAVRGPLVRSTVVAALVLLPESVGYGWPALRQWAPDLWLVLLVLAALAAVTALFRLGQLVRPAAAGETNKPEARMNPLSRDRLAATSTRGLS